jgi:hypothetical protein
MSIMTAKERLLELAPTWSEREAEIALLAVERGNATSSTAPLPEGWGETLTGEPMPDVVSAVRRSRESH